MNNQALTMFQQTVKFEQEYIWVKPICDFFNISYRNTTRKIAKDSILANQSTKKSSGLLFGDKYERVLLTKKGFIRWIQIINANTIKEDLRERFIEYQTLVFDFLFGSVEQNKNASVHYKRLKKLERLKSKISREIKTVKSQLERHWNRRYLQTNLSFSEKQVKGQTADVKGQTADVKGETAKVRSEI